MQSIVNQYNQTFFKWGSNSVPTYTYWAVNQPVSTESCISMYKDDIANTQYVAGEWSVSKCNFKNNFMCQKSVEVISAVSPTVAPGCLDGFVQYGSKCFQINDQFFSFDEAENYCVSRGGNLASISDRFEQFWMYQNVPEQATKWIGLREKSFGGTYVWTNSKDELTFTHWAQGYPDSKQGSCVALNPSGFWINRPCDSAYIRCDIINIINSSFETFHKRLY